MNRILNSRRPISIPSSPEDPGDTGWHIDTSFPPETGDANDFFNWRANVTSKGELCCVLSAHHAFSEEFDVNKPLKLHGPVTKWESINPHSWINLDVKGSDGEVTNWMVDGVSLFRLGFTKDSMPPRTEIVVDGYQAKDGSNRAVGAKLTFPDGRKLFLGGSAPGPKPDSSDGQGKR